MIAANYPENRSHMVTMTMIDRAQALHPDYFKNKGDEKKVAVYTHLSAAFTKLFEQSTKMTPKKA
jgi:hypothetical protein